ncbi:MAG: hypothetical protein KBC41_03890 [Candidatus Pacebacteria bacterium]|nr:hypothetical protein [Candidatus Paceibacterota bacterium]MBP9867187.1 hypothetical protein [Candidatus Paceibacterota bacterium]
MISLFIDYTKWHYTHAVVGIFVLTREFIRFFLNLFSFSLFVRTLFSPIYSIRVAHIEEDAITDILAVFIVDTIMRLLGAMIRLTSICLALFFSVLTLVFSILLFVTWLTMPVVFLTLIYGIFFFLNSLLI